MDPLRPRTSRARRRPEPLIAKYKPEDLYSGMASGGDTPYSKIVRPHSPLTKTRPSSDAYASAFSGKARIDTSYSKVDRPQTASLKPSRSRPSSGVRAEGRLQQSSAFSGLDRGVETSYSKVDRPQTASLKPSRSRPSSGVRTEGRLQHSNSALGSAKGIETSYSKVDRPQTAFLKPTSSRHSSGVRAEEKLQYPTVSSDSARGATSYPKVDRPQTASLKPSRSRPPSGVRAEERLQYSSASSGTETDTETIKAFSPKVSSSRTSLRHGPSEMHEKDDHYSNYSSSGTETETETLVPTSPNPYKSNPAEPGTYTNALKDYEDEHAYSSDFESEDDTATVVSVQIQWEAECTMSPDDSDGAETVLSPTPRKQESVTEMDWEVEEPEVMKPNRNDEDEVLPSDLRKTRNTSGVRHQKEAIEHAVREPIPNSDEEDDDEPMDLTISPTVSESEICLRDEAAKVPMLNSDEEEKEALDLRKKRCPSGARSKKSSREEGPKESLNTDDAEMVVLMDPKKKRTPSGARSQVCLRDEAPKVPMVILDDPEPKKKRNPSGTRSKMCLREEEFKKPMTNLDDTKRTTTVSSQKGRKDVGPKQPMVGGSKAQVAAARRNESYCGARSRTTPKNETKKVPMLDLDDLKSVSGQSVLLKSAHACTDLKQDPKVDKRTASINRLKEELKNLTLKNMLFFPSKNLTRPSIEEIYGPTKKRAPSLRRGGSNLKSNSNNSVDKTRTQKKPQELDTARPAAPTEPEEGGEPAVKRNEPKFLAPLMARNRFDRRVDRNRPTGPVKPKPFTPSGCGKGIPSLDKLPKPKIGVLPAFLQNRKKEAGNMKSASLSILENKELKPAIPSAAAKNDKPEPPKGNKPIIDKSKSNNSRTTNSLFIRNKIPLRKPGTHSTSNLISSMTKPKKSAIDLRPKKSVTFALTAEQKNKPVKPKIQSPRPEIQSPRPEIESPVPETESPRPEVESPRPEIRPEEYQEEIEPVPVENLPNSTYRDPLRQQHKGMMEKPPIFDEGPLPITEPSQIYLNIQKLGWNYSRFTPKGYKPPTPMIPYDFLDQYLHVFDNNLERAAVHTRYGSVTDCTCEQASTSSDFCEKHIDPTKLQYFQEVSEVMTALISFTYEIPEYEQAEKWFEACYPCIYEGWVEKQHLRLTMDYRVREAKCKCELVKSCERVLEEEDLLSQFLHSEEDIGSRRDISISGRMKDLDDDFELSYTFLFKEYPHLFIQLVEKIEFIPLALERKLISNFRRLLVTKANEPDEKLQEEEEFYRNKFEREEVAEK